LSVSTRTSSFQDIGRDEESKQTTALESYSVSKVRLMR